MGRGPARAGAVLGRRSMAALALLLGAGCAPVDILNALAPDRLAASGLPYGPGPRRRLDVYAPAGPGPHPVAMFLYGGGWDSGTRTMYRFVGATLAARGFVTVIPDYRLYPEVGFPDFLDDCAEALAWTRREGGRFGGDRRPPWLLGHSAGAYNAAMLALAPAYLARVGMSPAADIRGLIGLAGPYDFLPLESAELRDIFGADASGIAPADTQPIAHVDGRNPPALLLAGNADTVVLPRNTLRLAARIRAAHGQAQDRLYAGIGHEEIIGAFSPALRILAPTLRDSLSFMGAAVG